MADIRNQEDAQNFLRDFMKESELEIFAKRLAIVYWLRKGRSYSNIRKNLRVSSATIASVQQLMDKEGIKLAIKHIEADEWANKWSKKIKKFIK